ncbi:cyclase family protein [Halobacteria archaeon AArc-curdl1]|uniref:Cyclase family protein n=1 Tax=Natronosalvus hydrolyticus TaxID=2979988 RepID=A0AAP3E7H5_9EURY|nr:cyclase family protein [Halobacteria archaeon AArc-curdl1]
MTLYDLSHPLETGMPVYPGSPPVEIGRTATIESDGYATSRLELSSHTGTHMDAPAHMRPDGNTIDTVDLERFRFRAVVADCRTLEPRTPIDENRLTGAVTVSEKTLETASLLLCYTGWAEYWGTDRYFDHPYLTADAGEWLVEHDLNLGIDALNVDPTPGADDDDPDAKYDGAATYPFHHTMFAADRVLLENLRGLHALPTDTVFELLAFPLAVADGDGSPVRAVAVVEE